MSRWIDVDDGSAGGYAKWNIDTEEVRPMDEHQIEKPPCIDCQEFDCTGCEWNDTVIQIIRQIAENEQFMSNILRDYR